MSQLFLDCPPKLTSIVGLGGNFLHGGMSLIDNQDPLEHSEVPLKQIQGCLVEGAWRSMIAEDNDLGFWQAQNTGYSPLGHKGSPGWGLQPCNPSPLGQANLRLICEALGACISFLGANQN